MFTLFLYPVGNALFTLISGFVSDKFGRKNNYNCDVLFGVGVLFAVYLSGMFKWTPYLTGFAIGGFMGSYWGAGDTIGGIMFSESSPTNLRSSVTVINTLINGVMGRTCNGYLYDTASCHSRKDSSAICTWV